MGKNTIILESFSMVNLEDYFKEFNTEIAKYQWPDTFESVDDARSLLQDFIDEMNNGEMLFYSIKSEDGRFIGSVEVHGLSEECPELGVWVIESEQHKGYAYEALSMALDKAFTDFGKDKFYYEADIRNIGSTKLLQKFENSYEIIKKGLDETVTDSGKELKLQGYVMRRKHS